VLRHPRRVAARIAQVDDERAEIVAQAAGRGDVAAPVELADQRQEPLLALALAGGLVQRLQVRLAHALALGQRQPIAHAVHGAVLAPMPASSARRP
jgi:hypothetical protein